MWNTWIFNGDFSWYIWLTNELIISRKYVSHIYNIFNLPLAIIYTFYPNNFVLIYSQYDNCFPRLDGSVNLEGKNYILKKLTKNLKINNNKNDIKGTGVYIDWQKSFENLPSLWQAQSTKKKYNENNCSKRDLSKYDKQYAALTWWYWSIRGATVWWIMHFK